MHETEIDLSARLLELRHEFDRTFGSPRVLEAPAVVRLVDIRAGGDPLSMRAEDIGGVFRPARIVRAPGATESCLGLAGVRGRLVVVYSLAALLGLSREEGEERWMVLSAAEPSLGLAFAGFERFQEVDVSLLHRAQEERGDHVRHVYRDGTVARSVLSLESIVASIRSTVAASAEQRS